MLRTQCDSTHTCLFLFHLHIVRIGTYSAERNRHPGVFFFILNTMGAKGNYNHI